MVDQPRSSQRFEAKPRTDEAPLVKRMLQLARAKPRYGYRRIGTRFEKLVINFLAMMKVAMI